MLAVQIDIERISLLHLVIAGHGFSDALKRINRLVAKNANVWTQDSFMWIVGDRTQTYNYVTLECFQDVSVRSQSVTSISVLINIQSPSP